MKIIRRQYTLTPDKVEESKAKMLEGLDRLEREIRGDPSRYLVGESLSIADIAAASLFGPSRHGDSTRSNGDGDGLGAHGDHLHLPHRRETDTHLRLRLHGHPDGSRPFAFFSWVARGCRA